MDRRQNLNDPLTTVMAGLHGLQAVMWTALPASVIDFDPVKRTVSAQPTVKALATSRTGEQTWVQLPPLLDCPVFFPGGRGLSLTFPLQAGDEVLIVFASRCIDYWFERGGIQEQAELRMHSLSDGFCFPSVMSAPQAQDRAPVSLAGAELRNADNTTRVSLLNSGAVEVVTPGTATVTAGAAVVTAAAIALNGVVTVTGQLVVNGKNFGTHQHTGVTNGPNNTGGVL